MISKEFLEDYFNVPDRWDRYKKFRIWLANFLGIEIFGVKPDDMWKIYYRFQRGKRIGEELENIRNERKEMKSKNTPYKEISNHRAIEEKFLLMLLNYRI